MPSQLALNSSAALASIMVATVLIVIKGWGLWVTNSTAMLGSLADTGLDLISSVVMLVGVWVAGQPADANHRFGHGKAEALSAMFQVILIGFSALALGFHAVGEMYSGALVSDAGDGIAVSAVAMAGTLLLLAWQQYVIRRTASLAIATDHLHYKGDLLVNLAVIAALILYHYAGWRLADPIFGFGIALWLVWNAWSASQEALLQLMDHEWPEAKKAHFISVLAHHPHLRGLHDLRTRTSGNRDFVQFHVWVDGNMSVREAHRVMDDLETTIRREFPQIEILIHPDPEGLVNEQGAAGKDVLAVMQHDTKALIPRC